MEAVIKAEKSIGYIPVDCSKENKGWDIVSTPQSGVGETRFIEVKGRHGGAVDDTIHVSKNEVLQGFNLKDKFLLAYVEVEGDYAQEPLSFDFASLLGKKAFSCSKGYPFCVFSK